MSSPAAGGVVLDVGALRQMATGASVYSRVALATAIDRGYALVVPAAVLAAARARSSPAEAARLHVFLDIGPVLPVELGPVDAETVGVLLATADGSDPEDLAAGPAGAADLAAGHAALLAMRRHQRVVTDRPGVLRAVASDIEVDELP